VTWRLLGGLHKELGFLRCTCDGSLEIGSLCTLHLPPVYLTDIASEMAKATSSWRVSLVRYIVLAPLALRVDSVEPLELVGAKAKRNKHKSGTGDALLDRALAAVQTSTADPRKRQKAVAKKETARGRGRGRGGARGRGSAEKRDGSSDSRSSSSSASSASSSQADDVMEEWTALVDDVEAAYLPRIEAGGKVCRLAWRVLSVYRVSPSASIHRISVKV